MCYNSCMSNVIFRLDKILKERGTTPRPFSIEHGLNYVTVLRICRNETRGVNLETISKLCAVLEIKPGDLFETTGK